MTSLSGHFDLGYFKPRTGGSFVNSGGKAYPTPAEVERLATQVGLKPVEKPILPLRGEGRFYDWVHVLAAIVRAGGSYGAASDD